jgi:predicted ATPase
VAELDTPGEAVRVSTPLTLLVGRGRELEALSALLADPSVRLITLTGAGGSGKTRLALEVAGLWGAHFADGAAFVDLAPLADDRLVVAEIARVLGIGDAGGAPVAQLLSAALRERRLLLVLDNFEQILPAAADVAALLADCPGIVALVTSRAPLDVRGEREFPVPPLPVPSASAPLEELGRDDAVALFMQRARSIEPELTLDAGNAATIAEICSRLDGLPLAIELAAARLRVLSLEALLARLERRLPLLAGGPRDAPARQRTLRDTIAWSYDLLDGHHQRLFRGLGVFVSHVTLDGAELIAASAGLDALSGVETLVANNLLLRTGQVNGAPSLRMLETIREFALEQLERAGELDESRALHAAWCLAYAEAVHPPRSLPELPDQGMANRLAAEYDNLRAALAWFIETGQAAAAMRLASILGTLWFIRGYLTEGLDWLERARALPGAVPRPVLASASFMLGVLRVFRGAPEGALDHLAESLAIYRGLDDPVGLAATYTMMAARADYEGEQVRSQALHEHALVQFRRAGDANGIAQCLGNLADLAYQQGDFEGAYARSTEALTWFGRFDNDWTKAFLLSMHTHVLLRRGEVDSAVPLAGSPGARPIGRITPFDCQRAGELRASFRRSPRVDQHCRLSWRGGGCLHPLRPLDCAAPCAAAPGACTGRGRPASHGIRAGLGRGRRTPRLDDRAVARRLAVRAQGDAAGGRRNGRIRRSPRVVTEDRVAELRSIARLGT